MSLSKAIGAMFLIIGLCVGAGMIAIPMVTYKYGLVLSSIAICRSDKSGLVQREARL